MKDTVNIPCPRIPPHGFVIISLGILVLVVGVVGVLLTTMFTASARSAVDQLQATQAYYIGEAGLELATQKLINGTLSCDGINGDSSVTNANGGVGAFAGTFTVTAALSSAPGTSAILNGALSASGTIVPANTLAGYDSEGRLKIDEEIIYYWSTSTSSSVCGGGITACFVNAVRGIDGTTAASHSSGATITELQQCNLSVVAGIPSASSPITKRTLKKSVPGSLSTREGWAVGDKRSDGTWNIYHKVIGGTWTLADLSDPNFRKLLGTSMAKDGTVWIVGESKAGFYFNGSGWADQSIGLLDNPKSISAISSHEAWVVAGGKDVHKWTGATPWVQVSTAGENMKGISMLDTNNDGYADTGWAVGSPKQAVQYNGSNWTEQVSGVTKDLNGGVVTLSSTNAWAAGKDGAVFNWNGSTWTTKTPSGSTKDLNDISFMEYQGSDIGWVVGQHGGGSQVNAWYYNGSSWTLSNTGLPINIDLDAVKIVSPSEAYIGAANEKMYQWNGSSWNWVIDTNREIWSIDVRIKSVRGQAGWAEYFP